MAMNGAEFFFMISGMLFESVFVEKSEVLDTCGFCVVCDLEACVLVLELVLVLDFPLFVVAHPFSVMRKNIAIIFAEVEKKFFFIIL
jgi:hypothetical protein